MNNLLVSSIFNLSSTSNSSKVDFSKKEASSSFKNVFTNVTGGKSDLKGNKSEGTKSQRPENKNLYKAKNAETTNVKAHKNEVKKLNHDNQEKNPKDSKGLEKVNKSSKDDKIDEKIEKLEKVLKVDDKKLLEFINTLLNQNQDLDIKQLAEKLVNNFSKDINPIEKLDATNKVENIIADLVKDLQNTINQEALSSDNKQVGDNNFLELLQNKLQNMVEDKDKSPKHQDIAEDSTKEVANQASQEVSQQNLESNQDNKNDITNRKDLIVEAKAQNKESVKEAVDSKVTEVTGTAKVDSTKKDILTNQNINLNSVKEMANTEVKQINNHPVDRADIVKQIVNNAKLLITDNKKEMTINLNPQHLGKLTLKVVSENGNLTAKILTENNTVKEAIEANMDNLRESLKNQGLEISQFSVSVGQEQAHQQNQNAQQMMSKISKSLKVKNIMKNLTINSYQDENVKTEKTYHPESTVSYSA